MNKNSKKPHNMGRRQNCSLKKYISKLPPQKYEHKKEKILTDKHKWEETYYDKKGWIRYLRSSHVELLKANDYQFLDLFKLSKITSTFFNLFKHSKITSKFYNLFKVTKMTTKFLTCSNSAKWLPTFLLVQGQWATIYGLEQNYCE